MNDEVKYFQTVMDAISEAQKAHGVDMRGGKKYLEVSKRVEIFRKHYGMGASVVTEIVELGRVKGEPVVIRASIFTGTGGIPIATGTACEIIGDGNVNRASAVENAETSAIGRALACLGLHGGEFASLNEMERIGQKPENVTAEALLDAWEQGIMDMLPDDPSPETLAEAYADAMLSEVEAYKSARGVENYMRKHAKHLDFIKEHTPERHGPLRAAAWGHMQRLDGKAA